MKFVKWYWNCAAGLGTAVIIIYAGSGIMKAAQWLITTLQQLGNSFS